MTYQQNPDENGVTWLPLRQWLAHQIVRYEKDAHDGVVSVPIDKHIALLRGFQGHMGDAPLTQKEDS